MPTRSNPSFPVLKKWRGPDTGSTEHTRTDRRLQRLRRFTWILDRSIPIGGGWRIGLDPLLGLIPGAGDWIGAMLSLYVLYEAARMGLPIAVLTRIATNIAIEALVGTVPIAGDLFDCVWQANIRNLKLVEQYYRPTLRPRSHRSIWLTFGAFAAGLLTLIGFAVYSVVSLLVEFFSRV